MLKLFYFDGFDVLSSTKVFKKDNMYKQYAFSMYRSMNKNNDCDNIPDQYIDLYDGEFFLGRVLCDYYIHVIEKNINKIIKNNDEVVFVFEANNFERISALNEFVKLKLNVNYNLHLIISIDEECESDNYIKHLNFIPELDKYKTVTFINLYGLVDWDTDDNDKYFDDIEMARELLSDDVMNVVREISSFNEKGNGLYNHQLKKFELHKYKNDITFNDIESISFRETVFSNLGKAFCKKLKLLRKSYAKKHKINHSEEVCNYMGVCKGTCKACEMESRYLWSKMHDYDSDDTSYKIRASICGIERLREDIDGNGIRSLVIMPNCPLNCVYCINKNTVNKFPDAEENMSCENLYAKLFKDMIYFEMTNGGITFGGGEPLLQADYIMSFKKSYPFINIDVETSLNVPVWDVEKLIDCIDVWHIDIKDMNSSIYRQYTGVDNKKVIENLKFLIEKVSPENLHIRVPKIADYNTDENIKNSVAKLTQMGFKNIEIFEYDCTV